MEVVSTCHYYISGYLRDLAREVKAITALISFKCISSWFLKKKKKGFLYFFLFFLEKSTLSNGWLTVYQFYSYVQDIHDRMISLRQQVWSYTCNFTPPLFNEMPVSREEVWSYTCNLTPPLFIERSLSRQESERACIFVQVIPILSDSKIFRLDFCAVSTVWYFLFFD